MPDMPELTNQSIPKPAKKNRGRRVHDSFQTAAVLVAPALLVMGFIILYPLLRAFLLSFYNVELTRPDQDEFVWLDNFRTMLRDDTFWTAVRNTFEFTVLTVLIGAISGFIVALAIDQLPQRFAGLRGLMMIPWVLPGIVIGYLFLYMFDVDVGVLNFFLERLGLIDKYLPWLMNDKLAMVAVIIAHVWNQIPFFVLMITAGFKTIPSDVQEAALVEGAGRWHEFRYILLPYLRGIIVISSLLMLIRNFNNFPIIYTMTGGGPGYATTTAVLQIYKLAFEQFQLSYAAAVGLVWVVALLALSIVYIKLMPKDSELR